MFAINRILIIKFKVCAHLIFFLVCFDSEKNQLVFHAYATPPPQLEALGLLFGHSTENPGVGASNWVPFV